MTPRERTSALIGERRFVEACEPAAEWCAASPDSSAAWWDYGVALKHAQRWADCLIACDRAIALDPHDCQGPLWNAGIAATALGNWKRARAAWAGYGIVVPSGTGPLGMDIGSACVRVSPDDQPEIVFCDRLDPCRARILSVPRPESGRRFGDIVLHDGEPRGKRDEYTVFDEIVRLVPSSYATWELEATCATPEDRDQLVALFDTVDGAIEDWSDGDTAWTPQRRFGVAVLDARDLKRLRIPNVASMRAID